MMPLMLLSLFAITPLDDTAMRRLPDTLLRHDILMPLIFFAVVTTMIAAAGY